MKIKNNIKNICIEINLKYEVDLKKGVFNQRLTKCLNDIKKEIISGTTNQLKEEKTYIYKLKVETPERFPVCYEYNFRQRQNLDYKIEFLNGNWCKVYKSKM